MTQTLLRSFINDVTNFKHFPSLFKSHLVSNCITLSHFQMNTPSFIRLTEKSIIDFKITFASRRNFNSVSDNNNQISSDFKRRSRSRPTKQRYLMEQYYRAFHRFGPAKIANGGLVLGSSRFLLLPQPPQKMMLASNVVKIVSRIIILLC